MPLGLEAENRWKTQDFARCVWQESATGW